jgi:hypothetical protein
VPPWYFFDDGDIGLGPVLVPAESRGIVEKSVADEVYAQLTADYPKSSLNWVHHAAWEVPRVIPFADLNMKNWAHWRATHEPDRVADFTAKIKKRVAGGKTQLKKPAVVVFEPGKPNQGIIIDGHHRALGAEGAGEVGVLAWPGHVHEAGGPWMELHDLQFTRASGSTPHAGQDNAEDQVNGYNDNAEDQI